MASAGQRPHDADRSFENVAKLRILGEFREFALKGNVVDLAVGVIIGAAFGTVVKSLVDDVLMPILGTLLGGVDFANRYWVIPNGRGGDVLANMTVAQARDTGASVVAYGTFLNAVIAFLIIAWAVFLLIKAMNRLRRKAPAKESADRDCPYCFENIPKKATRCAHCTSKVKPV